MQTQKLSKVGIKMMTDNINNVNNLIKLVDEDIKTGSRAKLFVHVMGLIMAKTDLTSELDYIKAFHFSNVSTNPTSDAYWKLQDKLERLITAGVIDKTGTIKNIKAA